MTMLMQNGKNGLEIDYKGTIKLLISEHQNRNRNIILGHWVPVPFRENTFVVNLGNLLEHITFGVLKGFCDFFL